MSRRRVFGRVTPTKTSRAVDELFTMLPTGIEIIDIRHDIAHGTIEEFSSALITYEKYVADLADRKVDVIQAAGTPPFMLLGYRGEQELVEKWEKSYGVPIFTSGRNQIRALKALRIKKLVGIGYDFDDTSIVQRYFTEAGFDVLLLKSLPGPWEKVSSISAQTIYDEIKMLYKTVQGAEGIYIQGAKIQMLDLVEKLENDLGVPVVHPAVANAWEVMLRLDAVTPKKGFGRLLSDFPVD